MQQFFLNPADAGLDQIPPLMAMAADPNLPKTMLSTLKNTIFSIEEQTLAENVVTLLETFYKATTLAVCVENIPIIHKVKLLRLKLEAVSPG